MVVILLFSLGNASDAFLLLRFDRSRRRARSGSRCCGPRSTSSRSCRRSWAATLRSLRPPDVIALGWLIYAPSTPAFGCLDSPRSSIVDLPVYGIYFGSDRRRGEGLGRRPRARVVARGTAFGIYNAALGVGASRRA